jgi:beta-glucanase (GH16 family)
MFGRVEVTMQAAPGTGIVTSIVLESDDLDEIDWEWLGGDTTQVESNYFGKGNTTSYDRAIYHTVDTPQATSHTYIIDWTEERIEWIVDTTTVRKLAYADANGGIDFPQTPMVIKLVSS